jgi:hypothetical protein
MSQQMLVSSGQETSGEEGEDNESQDQAGEKGGDESETSEQEPTNDEPLSEPADDMSKLSTMPIPILLIGPLSLNPIPR